jgi:integrase/recombinase XerD
VFANAFTAVGMPAYHPHSIRKTLVRFGEAICRTPEQFKAWSQNLGHEQVMTTFRSYGEVAPKRQAQILAELGAAKPDAAADPVAIMEAALAAMKAGKA